MKKHGIDDEGACMREAARCGDPEYPFFLLYFLFFCFILFCFTDSFILFILNLL